MINIANAGKSFEDDIQVSCKGQGIFFSRIKDVFIPPDLRTRVRVPKNPYDAFAFYKDTLFALEFKSIKAKSISVSDPKIIKPHQIESLKEANTYEGVLGGFIFNFRVEDNPTFYVPIDKFIEYQKCALEDDCAIEYEAKVQKSLSIAICREIGTEIKNVKKKVKYTYLMKKLFDELKAAYT